MNEAVISESPGLDRITHSALDTFLCPGLQRGLSLASEPYEQKESDLDLTKCPSYRQFQNQISISERKFEALVNHSPDFIMLVDRSNIIRFINRTLGTMTFDEIEGVALLHFFQPRYHEEVIRSVRLAFEPPYEAQQFEFEFILPTDGSLYVFQTRLAPIFQDEKVEMLVLIARDITEQVQARTELMEQRNLFEKVIENSLAGYWETNLKDNTVYLSRGFKNMLGFDEYEIVNTKQGWESLAFTEDLEQKNLALAQYMLGEQNSPFHFEMRFRHKNGSVIWILRTGIVVERDAQGRATRIMGCHIDITKRKILEASLAAERQHLQRRNIALSEVIAHVDEEKNNFKAHIFRKMKMVTGPILSQLKESKSGLEKKLLELLETSLSDADALVFSKQDAIALKLTPKESQICIMLKDGLSAKEIAQFYHLSDRTIEKHKENIRTKLGIKGESVNLVSYLRDVKL